MRRVLFSALLFVVACADDEAPARAQWVVTLHTDAPVPHLGDRILAEVLDPSGALACGGCDRIFGASSPDNWPLSFGIPDPGGKNLRLRVRLFRADRSDSGGRPAKGLVFDDLSTLPNTGDPIRKVDVVLGLACAGVPANLATNATCDPSTGEATVGRTAAPLATAAPLPNSNPLGADAPCPAAAPEGMTCVPGGIFVFGNAQLVDIDGNLGPERLVRISPFALDTYEVTVAAMRSLVAKGAKAPISRAEIEACTYSTQQGLDDAKPAVCLTHEDAAKACAVVGKRLPTDAEWEYAASNRDLESHYPWGEDGSLCAHGVVARGRIIPEVTRLTESGSECRAQEDGPALPWGPASVGTSDDTTTLGIHDLGGNVAEWVADAEDPTCTSTSRILVDPKCESPSSNRFHFRGASWGDFPIAAESARQRSGTSASTWILGFRCAKSF